MKTLKVYILLFIATVTVAKAQFTKAELQVSGLTCSLCARTTEKSLKALPFVSEIKPDLMRNIYVITFKSDVPVDFSQISKKVKDSGFSVSYLKTTFNFDNAKIADNAFTYGDNTYKLLNADKVLTGPVTVTIVDKGFAPSSVTKKHLGKNAEEATTATGRTYHLTI
ncbi:heavy-metal-associated domain-containing protein [Mucilaginibacter lutimaris]|uniref:Heavy-metal-associated domain-containing protein n=1 Tax=Mucilaginibacter lutimaris TaxID=931629 RepID=A0ABW2ZKG6_9SPHI